MKSSGFIHAFALAALLGVAGAAGAQPGMGKYQQLYTQGAVVTVSGVVESVYLDSPPGVRMQAVYLKVKTGGGSLPVQLGPASFVQQLPIKFDKGDKLEVAGAKVTVEGKTPILAAQIKKGEQTVVLRDSSGIPVWAGQ